MRGPVSRPAQSSLLTLALYLLKDAPGLRVLLDLLDKALLVTLLKSPDAAEQQRGNRHKVLGGRVLDPSTELTGVGIKHHIKPPLRANSREHQTLGEVDRLPELTLRNDTATVFQAQSLGHPQADVKGQCPSAPKMSQ